MNTQRETALLQEIETLQQELKIVQAREAERERANQERQQSEEKYRTVVEKAKEGILVLRNGERLYYNPRWLEMTGYSAADYEKIPFLSLVHPDDLEDFVKTHESLAAGEDLERALEFRFITQSGEVKWLTAKNSSIHWEGQPAGMVFVEDITERKQAEEVLRALSTRQEAILAAVPDILMDVDKNKVYTWANPVGIEFFGEDVIGKDAAFYFEGEQDTYGIVQPLFNGGEDVIYVESWQRRKDGERRLLAWWCRVLQDKDGNVVGALSLAHDITERKQAEEEIRQLNAGLERRVEERTRELREVQDKLIRQEKLAVLGQLAGGVGHELRNPLGVINNAVYFLKLVQPEAEERVKDYLDIIQKETRTAVKIITDLLDFARSQSMDRELVSVSDLVQSVLERYPAPASVSVTLDFPASLPEVYVDPRQMEQVLSNLTINAYQAIPEGGKITLAAKTKDGMVTIAVIDTGVGIFPENMSQIFEPLFTTKTKGIGLGLAVSQKLAEANGGRIEVQSEPGQGSTFTLYLPAFQG